MTVVKKMYFSMRKKIIMNEKCNRKNFCEENSIIKLRKINWDENIFWCKIIRWKALCDEKKNIFDDLVGFDKILWWKIFVVKLSFLMKKNKTLWQEEKTQMVTKLKNQIFEETSKQKSCDKKNQITTGIIFLNRNELKNSKFN